MCVAVFLFMLRKTIDLEESNYVVVFISNHPHKYSHLIVCIA